MNPILPSVVMCEVCCKHTGALNIHSTPIARPCSPCRTQSYWYVTCLSTINSDQFVKQHRQLFEDIDLANMQQGVTEMLGELSNAVFTLGDPIPDNHTIEVVHRQKTGGRGRPRIVIDPLFLQEALTMRSCSGIAKELDNVSTRSVRRNAVALGLQQPAEPVYTITHDMAGNPQRQYTPHNPALRGSQISSNQLDAFLINTLTSFQQFGRNLTAGDFAAHGLHISRARLRASYQRVQGGPAIVSHRPIRRRQYHVEGPNSLWHHDGQHGKCGICLSFITLIVNTGLIRAKIVVHMFIDGKSRFITGARASNNNRSATVLDIFHGAIQTWGRPSRVRGDYGVENVGVADDQEAVRGRGSYIWGRSVTCLHISMS